MTTHSPVVEENGWFFRAACICGWHGRRPLDHSTASAARVAAVAHVAKHNRPAQPERCGKVRFATVEAASEAVLKSKLEHALHGNEKRREQRTYHCPACGAWHLTSQPEPAVT